MIQLLRSLRIRWWAAATVLVTVLTGCGPSSGADTADDSLPQRSEVDTGEHVIAVDEGIIAPAFYDNQWQLLLHEAEDPEAGLDGTWRSAESTVFEAGSGAILDAPDAGTYNLFHTNLSDQVWELHDADTLVTQVSTQAEEAVRSFQGDATLSLTGVQGPGRVTAHTFDDPSMRMDILWDSDGAYPQPFEVSGNGAESLHWAFSEPGTYLVQVMIQAELLDGSAFSDERLLRFSAEAEGPAASALDVVWLGPTSDSTFVPGAAVVHPNKGIDMIDWVLIALLTLVVLLSLFVLITSIRRAQKSGQQQEHTGAHVP